MTAPSPTSSLPQPGNWQQMDEQFAFDEWLGPRLHEDGTAELRMWSPLAENVSVIIYDPADADRVVIDELPMERGERGVWSIRLSRENTGLETLRGAFYNYLVSIAGETTPRVALDPYAPSLAPCDHEKVPIGRAAIINPSTIGPAVDFASIPGHTQKTDTIIWEVHVRDFTVNPAIESALSAPFGTFTAMIDKLDYIQSLGVTHVQLLPIMSYYFGSDWKAREREMGYSAQGNNYNWGYDPHSYFSISGMYSANPADPELRVSELKQLINAIHARGMGVILDVVFNHTANVRIFEDLCPGYYHFMDKDGTPRTSFGGGRLGTTHHMARRILGDSLLYWTREFKVDGFRFDMMGDHDAESIQIAYDAVKAINPNVVMIGEGWRTFVGDEGDPRQAADQDWMQHTDSVAVFSDEFRDELKSGFGSEGERRFLTGGPREIQLIFENIKAQPRNFVATSPGDVVPYIEAHDNLTLHDVIAQSICKDPDVPKNHVEIHRRIRLGNTLELTSQGVAFIHAGQEYGRTKHWRTEGKPEQKSVHMINDDGSPFAFPYFVDDSYDSTDIINMFEWDKATDEKAHPESTRTRAYTAGLIALRKSTDAFRLGTKELVDRHVTLVNCPEIAETDLVIAVRNEATNGDAYYVLVNADDKARSLTLPVDLQNGEVLVDGEQAGTTAISSPQDVVLGLNTIKLAALTATIIKVNA